MKARQTRQARTFVYAANQYPTQPGCYLMKDSAGVVFYVGKAKNLRRRLSSYFSAAAHGKARRIATRVRTIEIILVNNETESLILENNLIKQHKPRYNVLLTRAASGYAYIMQTGERIPRFVIYRKHRVNKALDGIQEVTSSRRFGPFVSRRYRDALLAFVNEYYGLRVCKRMPRQACLRYHLGKCSGICVGAVATEAYMQQVRAAAALLSYQHADDLIRELQRRMSEHSERLEFEKALKLRDQIQALRKTLERQVVERDVAHDQDVVFFGAGSAMLAHVVSGMMQDGRLYPLDTSVEHAQACLNFLQTYYRQSQPRSERALELIVNHLPDPQGAAQALQQACGQRIKITIPKRGAKHALLHLCEQNYDYRNSVKSSLPESQNA
jgi:excinuclease ABC subunit C